MLIAVLVGSILIVGCAYILFLGYTRRARRSRRRMTPQTIEGRRRMLLTLAVLPLAASVSPPETANVPPSETANVPHPGERLKNTPELARMLMHLEAWQEAERVVFAIEKSWERATTISVLVASLVKAGLWQEAERLALSRKDQQVHSSALGALVEAQARTGLWQEAERLALIIDKPDDRARALETLV